MPSRFALRPLLTRSCLLLPVSFAPGLVASGALAEAPLHVDNALEQVIVTATREAKARSELAESVGVISEAQLEDIAPAHPADALNRVAGVHVNNLGGEGHMTSIRQPISTAGVYLFLEDGIPTRPTGFFNHNGLYEINVPQSAQLEVTKGPASALYGSDAIGGVINAVTKAAPESAELRLNGEFGANGWRRALISGGNSVGENTAIRMDLNSTASEGFRDAADYTRTSFSSRLDSQFAEGWDSKTVLSYSTIDQSGVSGLEEADYRHKAEKNLYQGDIGNREVEAFRLSSELAYTPNETSLITATPFVRHNTMSMMPSWMVTYDPNIRDTKFSSYGLLLKYRRDFDRGEVIVGVDADYTPSEYREERIEVTQEGDYFTDFVRTGERTYHFEAEQTSVSPYLHAEFAPSERWRLSAGVRYDVFEVDYDDQLGTPNTDSAHFRPASQSRDYDNLSPKLGAVYKITDNHQLYASYRHAFRAPTVGTLFRPGSSEGTTELDPVTSVSQEIGLRGIVGDAVNYEVAVYDMTTENDIVSFISNTDEGSDRKTTNAGETRHQGVEVSVRAPVGEHWELAVSYAAMRQEYRDFSYIYGHYDFVLGRYVQENLNFAGNDISRAPESLGNITLAYTPGWLTGLRAELEWSHLGSYYTDETNTRQYAGHELLNLRASHDFGDNLSLYTRLFNLTDARYSTYTANQVGDEDLSYRPGLPRSLFAGVRYRF
ncbi:TonB-dependent receptor [Microbulbifer celer]|uniref:TonB-dependent receptor n=1 Tax=Microbulbifer celer TaxID=435905 RepID=A0ABW3U9N4_9GAMM|nr:TonB-dependent receptor [Microbulbifer celer]UFN57589.1 TonB-dependent receptor [Microbulbifer celer]